MAWRDLKKDIAEEFESFDGPRRADRLEEWSAWKRDRNYQQVKAQRERDRFLLKCIRQKHRLPPIEPLPRPAALEERARHLSRLYRLRKIKKCAASCARRRSKLSR